MADTILRRWQVEALEEWQDSSNRGIVSVVTGGGKTVFALACIQSYKPDTVIIVVPTVALLDQWWEETSHFFGLGLDEVNVVSGAKKIRSGTINLAVLNTASKLGTEKKSGKTLLIVDECHKAASEKFRAALLVTHQASLGLSATPERQYDDGLQHTLVPALGPIIYHYSYKEALADGVIVPFQVRNIVFEMEEERQQQYNKLTVAISRAVSEFGPDSPEAVSVMLRRARLMNLSLNRIRLTVRLVAAHRERRILIFHEDISACNLISETLIANNIKAAVYHSAIPLKIRAQTLSDFRNGSIQVLVTCRALDEGFNVPETEIGIIAASTATRRQRIQRLGRVLRPAPGKEGAIVYTLVCTPPEVSRLKAEEDEMDGIASVTWSRG